MIQKAKSLFQRIRDFIQTDIWHFPPDSPMREPWYRQWTRIVVLAWHEFQRNRCSSSAASLTFYTMMSLVPIMAVAFAIAKGFNYQETLVATLNDQLSGYPEVAEKLIYYANEMLTHTSAGGIAGVGALILFWSVIKLFSNIENAFNAIWGVSKGRTLFRKIADYLTFSILFLVVFLILTSLTGFAKQILPGILEHMRLADFSQGLITFGVKTLTVILSWVFFSLIYVVVPNTKVSFKRAFIPGMLAGTAFLSLQWLVVGQVLIFKANPIYGSLAALPLFLMVLQLSWLFLLFGGELSYAAQNLQDYAYEAEHRKLSPRFRRLLSFMILYRIADAFDNDQPPPTDEQLCAELNIPIRLLRELLVQLQDARLISQIRMVSDDENAWQPGCDTRKLTPAYIVDTLDAAGLDDLPFLENEKTAQLTAQFRKIAAHLQQLPTDQPLTRIMKQ